jgi:hypothetical protein
MTDILEPIELSAAELDAVAGGILNFAFSIGNGNNNGNFNGNLNGNSLANIASVSGNGNGNGNGDNNGNTTQVVL